MATIGSLIVNVLANTGRFGAGMTSARKQLSYYQQSVLKAQKATATFHRVLGMVGVGFSVSRAIGLVKQTTDQISLLVDTSDKLGIATDQLSALRWAGQQTGVEASTLDAGLQRLTKSISEAAKGTGKARKELKELGIDVKALNLATPDDQFRAVAAAISGVTNQADRVRIAFKLFGNEGTTLLNTLKLGASGLRQFEREAKDLGISLSQRDAEAVEEFGDKLEKLGAMWQGLKNRLVIDITPAASAAVDDLQEIIVGQQLRMKTMGEKGLLPSQQRNQRLLGTLSNPSAAAGKAAAEWYVRTMSRRMITEDIRRGIVTGAPADVGTLKEQGGWRFPQGKSRWPEMEQRVRDNERVIRDVGNWLRKTIGRRTPSLSMFTTGLEQVQKGIEEGKLAATAWARRDLASTILWGRGREPEIFRKQREDAEEQQRQAALDAMEAIPVNKDSPLVRGLNAALEEGSQEFYRASRANLLTPPISKQQLAEAKKQTQQLVQLVAFAKQKPELQMVSIPR